MHEPHDDPLERELASLSKYTGEPTSIWQEAIDKHRREQQQKLWVWVRRPAPALAAAALALLVASIAVRPIDPAADERRAAMKNALSDWNAEPSNTLAARALAPAPTFGGGDADRLLSRSAATGAAKPTDTAVDEKLTDLANAREHIATPSGLSGGSAGRGPVPSGGAPIADKALPAVADRSAGNRDRTGEPMPPSGVTAARSRPSGNAPASAAPPEPAIAAKRENQPPPAPSAGAAIEPIDDAFSPLDVTAEVRLQVPDVTEFYNKVVPSLVDVKNGETFASFALSNAREKDVTAGKADALNLTLRVSEDRLPQVLDELRRQSTVLSESAQTPPQAERLRQIDSLVELNEMALKQVAKEAKATPAPTKGAALADDAKLKKVAESLAELNQRRMRVEQGNDFATVNIVALNDFDAAPRFAPGAPAQAPTTPGAVPARGDAAPLVMMEAGAKDAASPAREPAPAVLQPAPGAETGKITRAAREGWSSLGDTTADFVGSAIGTMIYWLPALIAAVAALWWVRRRAADSMREPPPQ